MEETLRSNPIKTRLMMQNEILKTLSEFSDKLQKRANDVSMEVHELLDQAGAVELDLKNTFNSFRNLSSDRFIDHRIADEDDVAYRMKGNSKHSVEASIPVQNYETDILPRYKEALSLALTSCKNHLQSTKKSQSRNSIFRTGSAHGLLPHIIGSEEYNHDNSCGLTEDISFGDQPHDFSSLLEPNRVSSNPKEHDPPDLFGSNMLQLQEGSPGKDGNEPLVSAALDFKAMLEAALLNTYKLYDDESLSTHNVVDGTRMTGQTEKDKGLVATSSQAVSIGSSQHPSVDEEKITAEASGNLTSLEDPDLHDHEFYSALVSGSLFDAEEDLTSTQEERSLNVQTSADGAGTSGSTNKEEFETEVAWEDIDATDKNMAFASLNLLPNKTEDSSPSSSAESFHEVRESEKQQGSTQPVGEIAGDIP